MANGSGDELSQTCGRNLVPFNALLKGIGPRSKSYKSYCALTHSGDLPLSRYLEGLPASIKSFLALST